MPGIPHIPPRTRGSCTFFCILCLLLAGMLGCAAGRRPPQSPASGGPPTGASRAEKEEGATNASAPPSGVNGAGSGGVSTAGTGSGGAAAATVAGRDEKGPPDAKGGAPGGEGSAGDAQGTRAEGQAGATSWTARITGSSEEPEKPSPPVKSATRATATSGGGSLLAPSPGDGAEGKPAPALFLTLRALPAELKAGEELMVEVLARTDSRVVDAPLALSYDPALLRFLDATRGDFLARDGASVVFLANGQSHSGDVAVGIGRTDRAHGISGEGTICRVRFVALARGEASLRIHSAMAWGEGGVSLPVETGSLEVPIR